MLAILGLDAGDPAWIERWVGEGRLPAIRSVMARGGWARTRGPELVSEHGTWVSIFSGISRGQHGYYYFRQLRPGSYDLQTMDGLDVEAPRFWTRLAGPRVALIDVPDTKPVPDLPGVQLAHWATHNNWDPARFLPVSEPPELLAEVSALFGPQLVTKELHDSTPARDRAVRVELLERVRTKGALCRHLLGQGPFDLFVTVFAETHAANHQFWKYGPGVPEAERLRGKGLGEAIREVYEAVDREIETILRALPETATVVLVSSVGMRDAYPAGGLMEAFCRRLGYQADPGRSNLGLPGPVELARRLVPVAWREAVSRRIHSRERRESLLARGFRAGTDWGATTAFAIPAPYTSFVRVNLRGREPEGVVETAEYEALLARLGEDLRALVDPVTGEPAVAAVHRSTELFGGPPPRSLPDLFVQWEDGHFLSRVEHPRGEIRQRRPDFFRRSDHAGQGFFAAAGPPVPRLGRRDDVEVLDLTPTFLALLGKPVPADLPGKVRMDFVSTRDRPGTAAG